MEPCNEERKNTDPQTKVKEAKPPRFRIVKLEERIAPGGNGNHSQGGLATLCIHKCFG